MARVWDMIVGLFMLLSGLFISTVIGALFAMPIAAVLPRAWTEPKWSGLVAVTSIVLLLNGAAFYDFYRRRTINTALSSSGRIHLVPRGLHRMLYGTEPERCETRQ